MLEHTKVIWLIRTFFLRNQRHCTHLLGWNIQRSFDWSEHPFQEIRDTTLTCYVRTCKGHLTDQNIFPKKSEALHSHPMLEHAKVIWLIRTAFPRNQRHWTCILCWNMQRSFDWSEYHFWEIRSTALTCYVGTCKGHLTDQNILFEKSEALHSLAMLEHAKVIWLIRTSFLRNQRHSPAMLEYAKVIWVIRTSFLRNQKHCTHKLCWNMQRSFDWSEHAFWEIRGTALTSYVGTCKGHLTDQKMLSGKSEAPHLPAMLEHAKVIWLIRTSFLKNQRLCTHSLCWNVQRSFDWSEHLSWEIRGTALTSYVGTCKGNLTDQNILSEKSEALHSQAMLEHAKFIWLIRTSFPRNHTHLLCWNMQRSFDWSKHLSQEIRGTALTSYVGTFKCHFWSEHSSQEIRGTALTSYIGTCKGYLTDQNTFPKKSEALHSHSMLEHAKVIWLIRTSFPRNQKHCTHKLYWNMQR